MFERDFFQDVETVGPSKAGRVVGGGGMWLLHIVFLAFCVYSSYHGISASVTFRDGEGLGQAAGIAGIVVIEAVLIGLYLSWHNGRVSGTAQSIAAAATFGIGFGLAMLGIIGDSQMQAGLAVSPWLEAYLRWGLPVAPGVMAFGAMLVHELAPAQLRARRESAEREELAEVKFKAHIATMMAEMDAQRQVANLQLNSRAAMARQVASFYSSEAAQRAISAAAAENAPAMLRAVGIHVDDDDLAGQRTAEHMTPVPVAVPVRGVNGHGPRADGEHFFGQGD